jgi:hypothetical protein
MEYWSAGVLRQVGIALAQRVEGARDVLRPHIEFAPKAGRDRVLAIRRSRTCFITSDANIRLVLTCPRGVRGSDFAEPKKQ